MFTIGRCLSPSVYVTVLNGAGEQMFTIGRCLSPSVYASITVQSQVSVTLCSLSSRRQVSVTFRQGENASDSSSAAGSVSVSVLKGDSEQMFTIGRCLSPSVYASIGNQLQVSVGNQLQVSVGNQLQVSVTLCLRPAWGWLGLGLLGLGRSRLVAALA